MNEDKESITRVNFYADPLEVESYPLGSGKIREKIKAKISSRTKKQREAEESILEFLLLIVTLGFVIGLGYLYLHDLTVYKGYGGNEVLIVVSIVTLIRILVTFALATFLFRTFLKQEEKRLTGIPFLAGWYFYLTAMGKALDLYRSIYFYSEGFKEAFFIQVIQVRQVIMALSFAPVIIMCLIPAMSIVLEGRKSEKTQRAITICIVIILEIIFLILVFTIGSVTFATISATIIAAMSLFFIVWLFRFLAQNRYLPQVNTPMLWKIFLIYLIASFQRLLLNAIGLDIVTITTIEESVNMILFILMYWFLIHPAKFKEGQVNYFHPDTE